MYRTNSNRWIFLGLGLICLIFSSFWFFSAFPRQRINSNYYGMPMMMGGFWRMGLGIFGVILMIILIMGIFRNSSYGSHKIRRGYWRDYSPEAEEILRRRYANGEITKEQFDQMLKDLRREE